MRPKRAAFHANSWEKPRKSTKPCAGIEWSSNNRIRWRNRFTKQDQVSTTDPDSTYATKGGTPARLGYYDNYLVDNDSCVIVGVQATAARMSQETVAAQDMLTRLVHWQGRTPESVAADTTYGNGEFLQWLADRSITPYMRTRDSIHRKNSPFYGPERFTYQPEHNRYICPAGQPLNYGGRNLRNRTYAYIGTRKRCGACALKAQCTSGAFRFLAIHMDEPARQRARELANTPEFAHAQRQRKKLAALFAELKNQIGLRRLRLRRLKFVREQFFLAAAAPPSILPATTWWNRPPEETAQQQHSKSTKRILSNPLFQHPRLVGVEKLIRRKVIEQTLR
jgi:Transposase DDE domain